VYHLLEEQIQQGGSAVRVIVRRREQRRGLEATRDAMSNADALVLAAPLLAHRREARMGPIANQARRTRYGDQRRRDRAFGCMIQ